MRVQRNCTQNANANVLIAKICTIYFPYLIEVSKIMTPDLSHIVMRANTW